MGLWDPAHPTPILSLSCTLPVEQPLWEARPNVTVIKGKVVLGLG